MIGLFCYVMLCSVYLFLFYLTIMFGYLYFIQLFNINLSSILIISVIIKWVIFRDLQRQKLKECFFFHLVYSKLDMSSLLPLPRVSNWRTSRGFAFNE